MTRIPSCAVSLLRLLVSMLEICGRGRHSKRLCEKKTIQNSSPWPSVRLTRILTRHDVLGG